MLSLIEKLRTGVEQAQHTAKQASATVEMPEAGQTDYAQLANTLAHWGVPCVAEVVSISATGRRNAASRQFAIEVEAEGNGDPYEATVMQFLVDGVAPAYAPGSRWEAKADPEDRTRMLLYGRAW